MASAELWANIDLGITPTLALATRQHDLGITPTLTLATRQHDLGITPTLTLGSVPACDANFDIGNCSVCASSFLVNSDHNNISHNYKRELQNGIYDIGNFKIKWISLMLGARQLRTLPSQLLDIIYNLDNSILLNSNKLFLLIYYPLAVHESTYHASHHCNKSKLITFWNSAGQHCWCPGAVWHHGISDDHMNSHNPQLYGIPKYNYISSSNITFYMFQWWQLSRIPET